MENLKRLGEECRKWRREKGFTVKDLARLSSYSEWNFYKFEEGKNDSAILFLAYVILGFDIGGYINGKC